MVKSNNAKFDLKKRDRSRSTRMNETEGPRQNRLENDKNRKQSSRMNETKEQRQNRLEKQKKTK